MSSLIAWSDGGSIVAAGAGVYRHDLATGARLAELDPRRAACVAAAAGRVVIGTGERVTSEGEMSSGYNIVGQGVTVLGPGDARKSFAVSTLEVVNAVALSPDGARVAAVAGGVIRVWTLEGPDEAWSIMGPASETSGSLLPNGGLVTIDRFGVVTAWARSGASWIRDRLLGRHEARYGEAGACVSCDPTGRWAVSAAGIEGDCLRLWQTDESGGRARWRMPRPTRFAWSPDGDHVACVTVKTAFVASPSSDHLVQIGEYPDHVAFNRDGAALALAGNRGVALYRVPGGELIHRFSTARDVCGIAFVSRGSHLVFAGGRGLEIWDVHTGTRDATIALPEGPRAIGLCVTPDERLVFVSRYEGDVLIYDVEEGSFRGSIGPMAEQARIVATGSAGELVIVQPDRVMGTRLVACTSSTDLRSSLVGGHDGDVLELAFDTTGRVLASAGADGTIRLWTAGSPAPAVLAGGHDGGALTLAFLSDGSVASLGRDGTVLVHARDGRGPCQVALGLTGACGAIHSTGAVAIGGHDGTVQVARLDAPNAKRVMRPHTARVQSIAFDPSGRRVASRDVEGGFAVRNWVGEVGARHELAGVADRLVVRAAGVPILFGAGQFSGQPGCERVGAIIVSERKCELEWDAFLDPDERATLEHALRERGACVWPGAIDFMHATRWHYAWTVGGLPFRLVTRKGIACVVEAHAVSLADHGFLRTTWRSVGRGEVESVAVAISDNGVERTVRLRLRSTEIVELARAREPTAAWDPTYDAMDLALDASWARALAESLAEALGVPAELSAALR